MVIAVRPSSPENSRESCAASHSSPFFSPSGNASVPSSFFPTRFLAPFFPLPQALRGLAAAHKGGIIHRDLKPAKAAVLDTTVFTPPPEPAPPAEGPRETSTEESIHLPASGRPRPVLIAGMVVALGIGGALAYALTHAMK